VRSVVEKVALLQSFLLVLWFFPIIFAPRILRTHPHIHVALSGRTNGRSMETFRNQCFFGNPREEIG